MRRSLLLVFIFTAIALLFVAVAIYIPNSLPTNSDFSALYNTDLALVHRVPIYDLEQVEAVAVQYTEIPPDKFFLARFPYPPWFALSTFYLGFLPAPSAATLWFELNLNMLFLSVWLLTDGWPGPWRLIAFPLSLFFLPVLGALSVGQYDFPVLLGTSLLIYALRKENILLTVSGIVLLTFKPHIGALILFAAFGWLIYYKANFIQRILRPLGMVAVVLFLTGFIADPAWIVSYPGMLLNYQKEGNVSNCSECASLPVFLSRWFFDGSLTSAAWITLGLLLTFVVILYFNRALLESQPLLMSAVLLITLLVSPYLYNYDFLLLLIPLAVLVPLGNVVEKTILLLCYLFPTLALLLYGRDGNISLILVSMVMLILVYRRAGKPIIDFSRRAA